MAQSSETKLNKRFDQNIEVTGTIKLGVREQTTAGDYTSNKITLIPPYHTGGPFNIRTRDDASDAYISIAYDANEVLTIKHDGTLTVGGSTVLTSIPSEYLTQTEGDARYLQSFTETDPIFVASAAYDITTTNISNWNTAYGWGNHAGLYLGATSKASDSNLLDGIDSTGFIRDLGDVNVTNFDTLPDGWLGSNETTATNQPYANHHNTFTITNDASAGRKTQLFFADSPGGGFHYRVRQGDTTGWHPWEKIWTDVNLTNISQLTNDSGYITGVSWSDITGKPSTFTPSSHEHTYIRNVTSPAVTAADSAMPSLGYSLQHFLGYGPSNNDGHILAMTWTGSSAYGAQIWVDTDPNNIMAFRSRSSTGVWTGWNTLVHSGNISSQSVSYASNAGTLDNLDSTKFFRKDQDMIFDRASTRQLVFHSDTNYGSDRAFLYFNENSSFHRSGTENVRFSIGAFNDFANSSVHSDAVDIQGGSRLYLNAGDWDTELDSAIGTPATGSYLDSEPIQFAINNAKIASITTNGFQTNSGKYYKAHGSDTNTLFLSGNASATGTPDQFVIKHNYGNVDIGNYRGSLNFTSASTFTNNVTVNGRIQAKTFLTVKGTSNSVIAEYNTPSSTSANLGTYLNDYAFLDLASTNANGSWIDFSYGNGGDYRGRIRHQNSTEQMKFYVNGSGTETLNINTAGILVNGNITTSGLTYNGSYTLNTASYTLDMYVNTTGGWARSMRIFNLNDNTYSTAFGNCHSYAYWHVGDPDSLDVTLYDSSKGVRLLNNGDFVALNNVGIGMTTNPSYKLHVEGEIFQKGRFNLQRTGQGATTLIQFKNEIGADRAHIDFDGVGEDLKFYSGNGGTENLRIEGGGIINNYGATRMWHGGTGYYCYFEKSNEINMYTSGGSASTIYFQYRGGGTNIGAGAVEINGSGGTTKINKAGVGGVFEAPQGVFQCKGDMTISRGAIIRWANTSGGTGEYIYSKATSPYDVTIHSGSYDALQCPNTGSVRINYQGAQKFVTTSTGVSITGTMTASADVVAYSDERLKENVKTIDGALDKVKALRGVSYNRNDTDDKTEKIGVIAQEIQKVLPQVVQEQEDGMLGVSYGNIVGVLIEAMKEQQEQIDELKRRLDGSTN